MRNAPASIDAQIATRRTKLATCVKFRLRDLTEIGFTDLDEDVQFVIGDDLNSNTVYSSEQGMILSDIDQAIGFDSGNCEIEIPLGGSINVEDILGRRFNKATVWIMDIDHTQDSDEHLEVLKGYIADARVTQDRAIFEIRALTDAYNTVIGRVASPRCSADFGDTQCGVSKVWLSATVTAVISSTQFYIDLAGSYDDLYFRFGEVDFLTGDLANVWIMEVANYTGSTGLVELFSPAPNLPVIGDTLEIAQGCSRVKKSTNPLLPTCTTNDNVNRFRGLPRIPGSDQYVRIATPST